MVVSYEHKYLFVEVPSTGSTAISAELTEHYSGQTVLRKHANFTEFRKFIGTGAEEYFVFATVRNPMDLAVTDYLKMKGDHKSQFTNPQFFERNGGFVPEERLREFAYITENNADFSQYFLKFRRSIYHNWYLVGHSNFSYIMRYERLADEFDKVLDLIGLKSVRPLPKVNPTALKNRLFEDYYTPDTFESTRKYYGPFMGEWGYGYPSNWPTGGAPKSSRLGFRWKEAAVNSVARFVTLSPFSPIVQKVKAIADAIF